jgi:hypothetical protein
MSKNIRFEIRADDIIKFDADVIFLKYAQNFYGADNAVIEAIIDSGLEVQGPWPQPGDFKVVPTNRALRSPVAVFLGVKPLYELDYNDIRDFGYRCVEFITNHLISAKRAAMTMHGSGFGLDEIEAAQAQIAGCQLGLSTFRPPNLERITWVERYKNRASRFRALLRSPFPQIDSQSQGLPDKLLSESSEPYPPPGTRDPTRLDIFPPSGREILKTAAKQFGAKPQVFVAMPFAKEFEDTFHFGIQNPVRKLGFLCERIDQETFTGDVLQRIKEKIESASIVIGELTDNNANVYLEIGYAWGKGRPTILLRNLTKSEPKFDTQGQRILHYDTITDLNTKLTKELRNLKREL